MSGLGGLTARLEEPYGDPTLQRSTLIPLAKTKDGKIVPALPTVLNDPIGGAIGLLNDLREGREPSPKDAVNALGGLMGGGIAVNPRQAFRPDQAGRLNAIPYHGTGEPFPPHPDNFLGKFDDTRIGDAAVNGQAFGTGHYLAENLKVANSPDYRRRSVAFVGRDGSKIAPRGQGWDDLTDDLVAAKVLEKGVGHRTMSDLKNTLLRAGKSSVSTREYLTSELEELRPSPERAAEYKNLLEQWSRGTISAFDREYLDHLTSKVNDFRAVENQIKALDALEVRFGKTLQESPGVLYRVHVPDEKVEKMLDLDNRLGTQPLVQSKLESSPYADEIARALRLRAKERGDSPEDISGKGVYFVTDRAIRASANPELRKFKNASNLFHSLDIPGNKFLDGFSRNGPRGDGTRNFVLFKGEDATILGREGVNDASLIHPENKK